MGDCNCSKFTIMQLFHKLKQQFPALPDHIVSQCIEQNSHDLESCARSLRASQELRPPPGAFPPPAPQLETLIFISPDHRRSLTKMNQQGEEEKNSDQTEVQPIREFIIGENQESTNVPPSWPLAFRNLKPLTVDVGPEQLQCARDVIEKAAAEKQQVVGPAAGLPFSDPGPAISRPGFGDHFPNPSQPSSNPGFQLSVNVACGPYGDHDVLEYEEEDKYAPTLLLAESAPRSVTSVSVTLRSPTNDSQTSIIDVTSKHQAGPGLTYSLSTPREPERCYESRLQISIGKTRPPQRPTSLGAFVHNRPPGLPFGPPGSLPATPSGPVQSITGPSNSLPVTPSIAPTTSLGAIPRVPKFSKDNDLIYTSSGAIPRVPRPTKDDDSTFICSGIIPQIPKVPDDDCSMSVSSGTISQVPEFPDDDGSSVSSATMPDIKLPNDDGPAEFTAEQQALIDQVPDELKSIAIEQLKKNIRLARAVEAEEARLQALQQEIKELEEPDEDEIALQKIERDLKSQIYHLQLECERLAEEVDRQTDSQVPLGETDEEFYKSIYTGQDYVPPGSSASVPVSSSNVSVPPPIPSQPPAWEPEPMITEVQEEPDDGPSWVCQRCTFENHPLMSQCEQCDLPRHVESNQGTTQDIHIRVTRHNFSPRCTVHNWAV